MKKILELREKRAKAWEAAKAFLDSKSGAGTACCRRRIRLLMRGWSRRLWIWGRRLRGWNGRRRLMQS